MAEPKPGNSERGWNDPPMYSFASANAPPACTQNPPKRTLLNKRVAFPISGPTNPVDPSSVGDGTLLPPQISPAMPSGVKILPPALDTTTPLPIPLVVPNMVPASPPVSPTLGMDSLTETAERCMERLGCTSDQQFLEMVEGHLQSTFTLCKDCLEYRTQEEIRKKIAMFKESWEQNVLPGPVKVKMSYLASALSKKRFDLAFDIHLGLMVDYTAEVNNWMVGIKRLIHESKSNLESQNEDTAKTKRSGDNRESTDFPLTGDDLETTHCDKKLKVDDDSKPNS